MTEERPAGEDVEQLRQRLGAHWKTGIIQTEPGQILIRGYPIEQLIGTVSFPTMIWLMLRGELPSPEQAGLLEAALVSAVDHGPHAPSIAIARMAVSCGLPLNGAMASAVNVLDDVHGGAGEQAMALYAAIARRVDEGATLADAVEAGLAEYAAGHGKIVPGFGHRFHPVDPRSLRLCALVDEARARGIVSGRYADIGRGIERAMSARRGGKPLPMNIDGATAIIYSELGFPPALGRGLFILSRSVGVLAHAWEQGQEGIRIKGMMPRDIAFEYTGPSLRPVPPRPPR